jgi:transcriptional regulator GlxA family with amidase domain
MAVEELFHSEDTQSKLEALCQARTLQVGILIFPNVEVLDFAGPFEVFSVASRLASRKSETLHPPFRVSLISASMSPVIARHGLTVMPASDFDSTTNIDILIVPGGVVTQVLNDTSVLAWIQSAARSAALTASVCTGAFLLAKSGLLEGRTVTTHWEDIADLRADFPELDIVESMPYVDQGNIVTSGGISAGIEMSLHLVERMLGTSAAVATARQMEYRWTPDH